MTQAQSILNTTSAVSHLHFLHYSVAIIALASIFGAVLWVSKNKNKKNKLKVKLIEKHKITHDTVVFTFLLPRYRKSLGLKVGQHIQIEANIDGKIVNRKYTPISRIDRQQTFQLLVKIYHKCQQFPSGGIMSLYLDSLEINEQINISLPYGRFHYEKTGQVKIQTLDKKVWKRKYKNFFMVAGGTGITPLYQIIQYISQNQKENSPSLTLLFANRTQDDILLENQLKQYQKENSKLKVHFSVDKTIKPNWNSFVGYIDEEKIEKCLQNYKNDLEHTVFLSCGPPILSNIVEKIWMKKYNIKPENMFRF